MMKYLFNVISIFLAITCMDSVAGTLTFTIEDPGIATSQVADINLDTISFDSLSTGGFSQITSPFGTYTNDSNSSINPAGRFGGAGGVGNYLFIPGSGGSSTLNFSTPAGYFGLWWSAGDSGNILNLTLTDGDIIQFDVQDILTSPVLQPSHFGNPFTPFLGQNNSEAYAYINIFADNSNSKISQVQFTGTNFESDNHSATPNLVSVRGNPINVPVPTTLFLLPFGVAYVLRRATAAKRLIK